MRLLLDEDSQAHLLIQMLREAGHDVMTAREAGLDRHPDTEILAFARREQRVVLTHNSNDFTALHRANPHHSGILQIYHGRQSHKNMTKAEIVQAITNLEATGWDIAGQCVALNDWNFDAP